MCKFCEIDSNKNAFATLNNTFDYSGLEIAMHNKGMLRVRYYGDKNVFETQDIVNIKFCPICGRKLI